MRHPRFVFLLVALHFCHHVAALRFHLHGHTISPQLRKRNHISALDNTQNLQYFTNITLGEKQFSVSIDTGSSDLWVADNITNSNNTGVSTSVQYAVGGISGDIRTAQLKFLDFVVPDQAFIQVNSSPAYPEGRGLLGLGPNVGSNIYDALKKQPIGDTVLDRIFRQDPSTPNILTVLLSRSDDPDEQYPGQLTVSDILPGRQSILDQPKLPVQSVPSSRSGNQHWQVLLDPNGIIGPNGQPIALSTQVSGATKSSALTVIFDTGFSFNQVPRTVAHAIYSHIPGSKFKNLTLTGPIWTLPCNAEVNTTLLFGNMSFPIHPLDMNIILKDSSGNQTCVGGFQPITTGAASSYDIILGMPFLRNAYLLVNYGDFVDRAATKAPPYVQLLSVTDPTAAHLDFANTRPSATTTGMEMYASEIPDVIPSPSRNHRQTRAIVIGSVVGGCVFLISVVAIGYIAWRRQHRRHFAVGPTFSSVDKGLSHDHIMYHPLEFAPPSGESNPAQGHHTEPVRTSTHDLSDKTMCPPVAHVHEENHNNASPKYQGYHS